MPAAPPTPPLAGPFRIDRIVELEGPFRPADFLFPLATEAEVLATPTARDPRFYDLDRRMLMFSFHVLLVRTPDHVILVDTCIGNDKSRPRLPEWNQRSGAFIADLAAHGLRPGDVDFVLCTHLHADHVGWNTCLRNGRWVPTFPNARYLFGRRELECLQARMQAEGGGLHHGMYTDSVLPILDAGLAHLVEDDHVIAPGVTLHPAPGHTPGSVMLRLDDGSSCAWLIGDVIHHPLQVDRPDWYSRFCEDPAGAVATRLRLLDALAESPQRIVPAHFPLPTSVRIGRTPAGYRVIAD